MKIEKLVFLDECGSNVNMVRRYGRARKGERVTDHAPLNTPKTTTIISSIRLDSTSVFTDFTGSMTGERFKDYLSNLLVPTLKPGDFVVMDNLRAHHVKGVDEIIRCAQAIPLYLPPYSPDLNPIEMLWSKLKAILRKWRVLSTDSLHQAINQAFTLILSEDCRGWFAADGYY